MKKFFTHLFFSLCCFVASITANAQYSTVLESYPQGYVPTVDATFELTAIAQTLGTNSETLTNALDSWISGEGSNLFFLEDADGTRYSDYNAGGIGGFWMTAEGTLTSWTSEIGLGVWYNSISINKEAGLFVISIGQYPEALKGGEVLKAKFVLAYNGKEATFDIVLKIKEQVFSGMTEVGSQSIVLEQYPTTDYSSSSFSVDMNEISTLLNADVSEISLWAPTEDGNLSNGATAGNQGFWYSKDGYRTTWGTNCGIYVENSTNGDFSSFNVGQYPLAYKGGETATATLYFVAGTKYYTVNINMNILLKEDEPPLESVATRTVYVQIVPSENSYEVEMEYTIDPSDFELIGTDSPTLYARMAPAEGSEWAGNYDDRYSCSPSPGFWMSTEGYRSTWGTEGTNWAFSYLIDETTFKFFQMPGRNQVGDEYQAYVYLMNEETGKMITYDMNVLFVEKVIHTPSNMQKTGELKYDLQFESLMRYDISYVTVDEAYLLNALGCNDLSEIQMMALDSDGILTDTYTADDWAQNTHNQGFWFDINGAICEWNNNDAFYFTRNMGNYSTRLTVGQTTNGLPVGTTSEYQLFFVYGNKYVRADFFIEIIEETIRKAADFTIVGEQTLDFEFVQTNDFVFIEGAVDAQAISYALGCNNEECRYYSLAADGTLIYSKTAANQGFWYNSDNQVIEFTEDGSNDEAYYIEQSDGKYNYSVVRVGAYPNHVVQGGDFSATHYLIYGNKAFLVHFSITILPPAAPTTLGDANCDGAVDIVDVTTLVDFILAKDVPTDAQRANSDVNKDGSIDIVDLTSIVSIILGTYTPSSAAAHAPSRFQTSDFLSLCGTEIGLTNNRNYVAFQMDVTLTDDATLNKVLLTQRAAGHTVSFRKVENNTYRIVGYSMNNTAFSGTEGKLLSFDITGNQNLEVSNILFAGSNTAYSLGISDLTGLKIIDNNAQKANVYDFNGRSVNNLRKGNLFIVNGKKAYLK